MLVKGGHTGTCKDTFSKCLKVGDATDKEDHDALTRAFLEFLQLAFIYLCFYKSLLWFLRTTPPLRQTPQLCIISWDICDLSWGTWEVHWIQAVASISPKGRGRGQNNLIRRIWQIRVVIIDRQPRLFPID